MSNDDGTIPPDKFTWWYLQEILTNNRYYAEAKFPGQDVLEVPNTMFYDIDLFEQWINIRSKIGFVRRSLSTITTDTHL